MGLVYRATDPTNHRTVALKTLSANVARDTKLRERFFREGKLASTLTHPNIVKVYEYGEMKGRAFIAMELLEGQDLKAKLSGPQPLSLGDKIQIVAEVCAGLGHAHGQGVVHRDIKPTNVFICRSGQVKILDFGIARVTASKLTRTGELLGTANYMSPEQVVGKRVDHRSDIFSTGVLLYELLTGEKAFKSEALELVLLEIITKEPPPIRSVAPAVPTKLCQIVEKAMAKDPSLRYQTIGELGEDLGLSLDVVRGSQPAVQPALSFEADTDFIVDEDQASTGKAFPPEVPNHANQAFERANVLFSEGNLAGCLKQLGEVLAVYPKHEGANTLAERLRSEFVERADRGDTEHREAILAVLDTDQGLNALIQPRQKHQGSKEIAELGNLLLSELGPFPDE